LYIPIVQESKFYGRQVPSRVFLHRKTLYSLGSLLNTAIMCKCQEFCTANLAAVLVVLSRLVECFSVQKHSWHCHAKLGTWYLVAVSKRVPKFSVFLCKNTLGTDLSSSVLSSTDLVPLFQPILCNL